MPDAAYHREYRRRRKAAGDPVHAARIRDRTRRDLPSVTFVDALMILVVAEVERLGSYRALAGRLGMPDSLPPRWMLGVHRPGAEQIDALVDYFGVRRVLSTLAAARRIIREDPGGSRLTPANAPGPFLPRELRGPSRHPWRSSTR